MAATVATAAINKINNKTDAEDTFSASVFYIS